MRFLLTLARLVQIFAVICGTQIFITVFTKAHIFETMCADSSTIKVVTHPRNLQYE
jgi:hypothetical protein